MKNEEKAGQALKRKERLPRFIIQTKENKQAGHKSDVFRIQLRSLLQQQQQQHVNTTKCPCSASKQKRHRKALTSIAFIFLNISAFVQANRQLCDCTTMVAGSVKGISESSVVSENYFQGFRVGLSSNICYTVNNTGRNRLSKDKNFHNSVSI